MDAASIAQTANPFIQTIFIVIMGLGYYFTIKTLRGQVQEAFQERTTGGRPLIIVTEDYENLPTINLIVQNVGPGPAKNITFKFSSPVKSSDGYVLSDLAFFEEGITSLAPGGRIVCYWDELQNLQQIFEKAGWSGPSRSRLTMRTSLEAPTPTSGRLIPYYIKAYGLLATGT